ncbi:MAG: 6-pyruvoyl trahydropterin synthase family protein [Promethearchaeota archaeon]
MVYKVIVNGPGYKFSSAHFIQGHVKCGKIHGHNFHVNVSVEGKLGQNGFVIDFITLKGMIKDIIEPLDHKLLVPERSQDVKISRVDGNVGIKFDGKTYSIPETDICMLPVPVISSEWLARYIHDELSKELPGFRIIVQVGETPSSFAEYREK